MSPRGTAALAVIFASIAVTAVAVSARPTDARHTVRGYGIRLPLPAGWNGRIYVTAGSDAPVLQAATRPLARETDDLGRRTQRSLGLDDLLIVLWEIVPPRHPPARWPRNFPHARPPLLLHQLSGPFEGQTAPASATRGFRLAGRYFQLFAFFGTRRPGASNFARANSLLARLEISPFSRRQRAALRKRTTALRIVRGVARPAGFRVLETLHGLGTVALRCTNDGVATAFVADPRGADSVVTVSVDAARYARRKLLPGKSLRTPALRSHVHRWEIVQSTEARTAKAIVTVEAPSVGRCYAVPAVLSSLRMTPH